MTKLKNNSKSVLGINVEVDGKPRQISLNPGQTSDEVKVVPTKVLEARIEAGKLEVVDGAGEPKQTEQPKTAAEVLAMADTAHFQTFKAEAGKVLGEGAPSTKEDLVAALKAKAEAESQ